MQAAFQFLASTPGRVIRAGAGVLLILVGLLAVQGVAGIVIALVGLAPLAAGVFDLCLFAPLAGLPLSGSRLRGAH